MSSRRLSEADDQSVVVALRERIRELEALNERLRDSEERFQILFEHAPDGYTKYILRMAKAGQGAMRQALRQQLPILE